MDNALQQTDGWEQIADGVFRWTAPHPEWIPNDGWDRVVAAYAFVAGELLVVIDPIAPPAQLLELARGREVVVLLTCPWHVRDAERLVKQLGGTLYSPPADEADPAPLSAHPFVAGDLLPGGFRALPGLEPNDLVLYGEPFAALVFGDTLVDRGEGLIYPRDWADRHGDADAILVELQQLRDLDVRLALPTHGHIAGRADLLRALD